MQQERGGLYLLGLIVDIIFMIPVFIISGVAFVISGVISIIASAFTLIAYVIGYTPNWLFFNGGRPQIVSINGELMINPISHPIFAGILGIVVGVVLIVLGIAFIALRQWYRRCYATRRENKNCYCR